MGYFKCHFLISTTPSLFHKKKSFQWQYFKIISSNISLLPYKDRPTLRSSFRNKNILLCNQARAVLIGIGT